MKKLFVLMTTAALGFASLTANAEEYYRTNSSGFAAGCSHSGKYIVGSNQQDHFIIGGVQDVWNMNSYLWNTQTNSVEFRTTSPGNDPTVAEYEKTGCFLSVNDNGVAVGYYKNPEHFLTTIVIGEEVSGPMDCAAYWKDGKVYSLGLGDIDKEKCTKLSDGTKAYVISDNSKIIAGTVVTANKAWPCTWILQNDGTYKFNRLPIHVEEGVQISDAVPTGISADGTVISGYVSIVGNGSIAVVWMGGEMYMLPPLLSDLADPTKEGMYHKAMSVSANGKYVGVVFDRNIPVIYDIEAGKYVRMEYGTDIKPNDIDYIGVNDKGDGVCSLKLRTGSANEKCLIYKADQGRTLTFNYFFKTVAPALDIDLNISLMGISNDGNVFSATHNISWDENRAVSIGVNSLNAEIPPTPNPVKSKLVGLKKVELSWEAVNNQTKTWNVKEYRVYQNGKVLITVPYAQYAKDYSYTVEDSATGYLTYHTTVVYENEDGVTIESPRSEYTDLAVAPNFDFPCNSSADGIWSTNYWTKTYQIPYDEMEPVEWGKWSDMYGFDGGAVGKCTQYATKPYSTAMESRPIDATNINDNIYVSFPCMYMRASQETSDYSREYLSVEVSTDLGKTWTEAKTWSGDQLSWRWGFDYADITDLVKGKIFQVRLRRHGEGKGQFTLLVDYININTQVGVPVEGLTSFDKDADNIELIWKNNFGAYDLNYMGNAYGNAYVLTAANAGKSFIGATEYNNEKLAPFDGKYISGITTAFNWYDKETADNPQIDAKILIWEDGKLIREQVITDKRTNRDYVIPLDEPVKIDASKTLRVGISIDNYPETEIPLLYVNSMVYVNGMSDLYSEDGGKTWSTLEEAWLTTEKPEDGIGSWRISCDITDTPGLAEGAEFNNDITGFNVYRNGEKINGMMVWVLEGRYTTPKEEGTSEYRLMPIYKKTGMGPMSEVYKYTYSGIEDVEATEDEVGVVYDGDSLTLNGNFSATALYNMAGMMVARLNGKRIDTTTLAPGLYMLQVSDGQTGRAIKFIKR